MNRHRHLQKAAALPFVLLIVALNVTVVVALLIYATTELQASRNSVQAEAARTMAQSGIDLAASLIAANSTNNGFVTYQRVTNVGGAWRLETKIANVAAPDPTKPWIRVATNPAALHSGFSTGTNGVDLNFAVAGDASAGFIAPRTNLGGWQNLSPDMFRMNWIYVYKGPAHDPKNLVGRFAYWVDDESTKLNINYSGTTNAYDANYRNNQTVRFYFATNRPAGGAEFNGRIWPIDMELGGIAGLSTRNAFDVINFRGFPTNTAFQPFPSVLALRLGTIDQPGGIAVTNLYQQSELAFTATASSAEDERSYATGRKRFDLLEIRGGADTNAVGTFVEAITADNPAFAAKYNLPAYAWAAYSLTQLPGANSNTNSIEHPATTFGDNDQPIYVRGLPVLNEVAMKVVGRNTGGTNTVEVSTRAELLLLSQIKPLPVKPKASWYSTVTNAGKFQVLMEFKETPSSPATFNPQIFGSVIERRELAGSGNSTVWFQNYLNNGGTNMGPSTTNFSGALAVLSSTNTYTNTSSGNSTLPAEAILTLLYDGKPYQTVNLRNLTTNSISPPAPNQTNIYHLVASPESGGGYRGDPRFGVFSNQVAAVENSDVSGISESMGLLGPGWKVDDVLEQNKPDLAGTKPAFAEDKGLPNYNTSVSGGTGFSAVFSGNGWIGEVPVTTASGQPLAWSTPRLWGDGRTLINGLEYPPDWLLLDSVHMDPFKADPSGTFRSRGRVNVNSAKPFFQTIPTPASTNRTDTITDSVMLNARTFDFNWMDNANSIKAVPANNTTRTNLLARAKELALGRTGADNPYTTHFEFLADLAATNLPNKPTWWMAPDPATGGGDIYAATNTTDRRIEGIVRSLNQKLTTHGNQFSIFSLGQALQVTPSGQTNVVGEAYLQAVYERAPAYDESSGAITNSPTGAPPMRQIYLRELRY